MNNTTVSQIGIILITVVMMIVGAVIVILDNGATKVGELTLLLSFAPAMIGNLLKSVENGHKIDTATANISDVKTLVDGHMTALDNHMTSLVNTNSKLTDSQLSDVVTPPLDVRV